MKHFSMKQRKDKPAPAPQPKTSRPSEAAFDVWLQRGLHELFDNVAREPLPPELLKLIEEDRTKEQDRDQEGGGE